VSVPRSTKIFGGQEKQKPTSNAMGFCFEKVKIQKLKCKIAIQNLKVLSFDL